MEEYRDQFLPYEDVLDCNISASYYNGTLFRFPLRDRPSELSKKTYTPDKVRKLFEALKQEASVILLFLKNIEEISLFETNEMSKQRCLFSVCLSNHCRQDVHKKKKRLLSEVQSVNQGNMTHTQLSLSMNIEERGSGHQIENKWLVYHQIDARDMRIKDLSSELGLLPWISFATPLSESNRQALPPTGGRIFCFLPLPPDSDVKTGFPVHIHGYFGLTDNRRGLKWPGLDCQNDLTADWNVLLLEKVGSKAYANMLESLVLREPGASLAYAAMVYQSWPNAPEVDKNWKRMLHPMFSVLQPKDIFWTPQNGGHWVRLQDALLDTIKSVYPSVTERVRDVVLATLTQANEAVVTVPQHVMAGIYLMGVKTNNISPALMRRVLKQKMKGSPHVANMPRCDKLSLLEFVVQDKNLNDIQDVPLLPLADGTFVDFRSLQYHKEPNAAVYVSSKTHSRSLFYQMDNKFLDDERANSTALEYLAFTACDVESSRCLHATQLVKVNTNVALNLLREMLPYEWCQADLVARWYPGTNNHPPESWLADLWKWIQTHFRQALSEFQGFPLVPHVNDGKRSIVKLRMPSVVIRHQWDGETLPSEIVSLLGNVGCIVLATLPSYVNHVALHEYIAFPNPKGVLNVLQALGWKTATSMISICSSEEKRVLRSFLSRLIKNLSSDDRRLLLHLPIFETANWRSFTALQEGSAIRHIIPYGFQLPQGLPVPNASQVVSLRDSDSYTLVQRLGLSVMTKTAFLVSVVFPGMFSIYNQDQISTMMCWVLRQYHALCNEDSTFHFSLKKLSFVPLKSGRLVTPEEAYDPKEPLLRGLFEGESDKFPHDVFAESDILSILRNLGMKDFPATEEIANVARGLHNFDNAVASRKASALFNFLDKHPIFIKSQKILVQQLMDAKWVKQQTERPSSYPREMPFFKGKVCFFKPSEVLTQAKANLVGSSMPLVFKSCSSLLEQIFGWNKVPVESVLKQLRFACTLPLVAIKGNQRFYFQNMLKEIYRELASQMHNGVIISSLKDDTYPPWVWRGEGFSSPSHVAFNSPMRLNLKPYCFVIPSDFQDEDLESFFRRCGVRDALDETDLLDVLKMVKEDYERDPSDRLRLSREILQWIVRDAKPLSPELREKVLVPVISWDSSLKLVPCSECTFCDAEWLKKGGTDLPITNEFPMIHETISPRTAELLGVPPISTRLVCAETLGIEQAGPHEPITTRIKNILNEYKEGAGVFRELIQNADDAGATEITFVLDWRNHPSEKVLSNGMADCQGPALLVYNNSVFSDDDFKNITKLAGATKIENLEKIGRFGLGFNSVYHFTDVPCFISRHYAVFFDPHTTYLGAHIPNSSQPGIKLNLDVNPAPLSFFHDQFMPFNGLFGCDVISPKNTNSKFHFQGTLFRLAFRTKRGDISRHIYSEEDIHNLLHSFEKSSPNLLLFTQNVKKVSLLEIESDAKGKASPTVLFELCKETEDVVHSNRLAPEEETFLQSCASWTRRESGKESAKRGEPAPERTELVSVTYSSNRKTKPLKDYWLITSALGCERSFQLATSDEGRAQGLLSSSGVAANVSHEKDILGLLKLGSVLGEAFCFLPLSISTGLPVHVNGYFAVTSNRRGIWEKTTTDSNPLEVRWNISLMEDAVSKAYIQLFQDISMLQQRGKTSYRQSFALWPDPEALQSTAWKPLLTSFYQKIAFSKIPVISIGEKWFPVDDCVYQDDTLDQLPGGNEILMLFGFRVANLPLFVRKGFQLASCSEVVEERTMTQRKFLEEIFFPRIHKIPSDLRNAVVCYLIDECLRGHSYCHTDHLQTFYRNMLQGKPCIPCGPNSDDLAAPKDLVNPNGAASELFSPEDKRFPFGQPYRTKERLLVLEQLGMVSNILDWDSLCERASSVPHALKRISSLVKYLNDHLRNLKPCTEEIKEKLQRMKIFPVLPKPAGYTMSWKGPEDGNGRHVLLSAKDLYEDKYKFIAGASKPILNETMESGCGELSSETRNFFGFNSRVPTVQEALKQLEQAIENAPNSSRLFENYVQVVSYDVYDFLQQFLSEPVKTEIVNTLNNNSWVLIQGKFLPSSQLAFCWKGSGEPYLYEVPWTVSERFRPLLKAARVKEKFCSTDFIHALHNLKLEKNGNPLTNTEFKAVKCFLDELLEAEEDIIKDENGGIPLPDVFQVLHEAKELAINDAPWVRAMDDTSYVHPHISIDFAYQLGATDIRSKKLDRISRTVGRPFGQREQLTDRLKGILKAYPCDVGILKELVQNADDAGATEIHFIYDPRSHPTKHLLSDNWKELQGPSLCVYNNRPFSEEDLEGIQRLGIGSKAEDPTKTGQYGIGFNAVYHLTDCPSFISNGDTLCVLDPHCRYAPGATPRYPDRLIGPLGEEEREDYRDIFSGYLESFFDLTSATMFRFPLRNGKMSAKSLVSKEEVDNAKMTSFMKRFSVEAKDILMFLNHVTKISLSKVEGDHLKEIYWVMAHLTDDDTAKRVQLSSYIRESKALETNKINLFGITYPLCVKDTIKEEKWLIHQCIGLDSVDKTEDVPNGQRFGLLPRGGVAFKVSEEQKISVSASIPRREPKHKAFCFLPLPVDTGLPVHINGHFYLDSARRNLWRDENNDGFGSKWNDFIMTSVVTQAYVSVLRDARHFVPYLKQLKAPCFSKELNLHLGMQWYHDLFPRIKKVSSHWKRLATALFQRICKADEPLLPLIKKLSSEIAKSIQVAQEKEAKELYQCCWLSPSEGFFNTLTDTSENNSKLAKTLVKVGFQLLYSKCSLFEEFKTAETGVREISPDAVLGFLKEHSISVGQLPCPIGKTTLGSVVEVLSLLDYCMKTPQFATQMSGAPLLLTEDNVLRCYKKNDAVFLSLFSDLLPDMPHLFIHHSLANALVPIEDCICKNDSSSVLKRFDISALASRLPSTAVREWCERSDLIRWDLDKGLPSKKWLERLWEFLFKENRKSPNVLLDALFKWPIVPTTSGMLAPISKGKAVLDLTPSDLWFSSQKRVVDLLRKLRCHEFDLAMVNGNGIHDVSIIIKKYLAHPNSAKDVLSALDFLMNETDISGILSEDEMLSILQFLQDDITSLQQHFRFTTIVRRLPFFKSFHGEFVSLDEVNSIFVVPLGLPTEESDVWMAGHNCVFLVPSPKLDRLYNELLGINERTHVDCYINFIFPKFRSLKECTRMRLLHYIRRSLLVPDLSNQYRSRMLNALKELAFIPDASGQLQKASFFYDPEEEVFAVMLPQKAKPPEQFGRNSGWLDILREIGLKQNVSKDLFMTFANEVADKAVSAAEPRDCLTKKSKTLVSHLLKDEFLREATFLSNLSTVKFVVPHNASDKLLSLYKQHRSPNQGHPPPFTQFKDSVPDTHEMLTWTTVSLLPPWAVPKGGTLLGLKISKEPSLDQVINHVINLSRKFSKDTDRELPEPKRRLLSQIMKEVYDFLQCTSVCKQSDSLDSCSQECYTIGQRLADIPCILVEGGRVFVRCDQLAFEIEQELRPYLYKVPREYGTFEHLFKRLGATEKACPEQFAKLLSHVKESLQGEIMNPNEMQVVKGAVFGFFSTLKVLREQNGADTQERNICKDIDVLYLPSSERKLKLSTELVLFNCPAFKYRIPASMFDFLDELATYNLTSETPTQLMDLLPGHLKTKSLKEMVREDLHPDCVEKKCQADVQQKCQATNRLRLIMYSPQLLNGIERILKHQFQKAKLTVDVRNNVRTFQTELSISCMEVLVTQLVINGSNDPILESKNSRHNDCFVGQANGKKQIFIKHGVDSSTVSKVICKELYQLTGCYIERENWLNLLTILESKSPDDIPFLLDKAGVSQDVESTATQYSEPQLGSEVPQELHHLLEQYDDFFFREGEFVAYEKEDSDDLEPKYVFARIIRKLQSSASCKAKKDRTKRKQRGESNLLSRYLIDMGDEQKEVDVLDLYKIKRPRQLNQEDDQLEDERASEARELVLYTGTGQTSTASPRGGSESPKPRSLEEALKEVKKALAEIWKLPEDKRRKAIRRLYLRWHPDKNMDMQYVATKVTQFIQNEVERLSKGGPRRDGTGFAGTRTHFYDFNFAQWNQRAQRQRSSYQNFRRHNPRFNGFSSSSRRRYTAPDTRLSRIWLHQSREDLRSIKYLLAARDPLNWLVCFQCHQVAEKALKAALYALSGVADSQLESHDLVSLAYDLSLLSGTPDVTPLVAKLSDYYNSTRYPNQHTPPTAPADVYLDSRQVQEAFQMATEVLNRIEQISGM